MWNETVENKELVMVGVDWQLEKFKSLFKAKHMARDP